MLRKTQHLFSPYRANYAAPMSEALRNKVLAAFDIYSEGGSIHAARYAVSLRGSEFYATLRQFPDLETRYQQIQRDRADMMVDEAYDISTDSERHPGVVREQVRARIDIAKLYDRKRFGDKLDISLDAGPSVVAAIAAAKSRLPCDPGATPISQVIDAPYVLLDHATDKQSAVLSKDDFFAD